MNCLQDCESEIETHLLRALYPKLGPDVEKQLQTQHRIDYYDIPLTIPDFAFPDAKIAIYCDGYEHHSEKRSIPEGQAAVAGITAAGLVRPTFRGVGNPERDGRGSSHDRASDTAESAGAGRSRETATDAGDTPNTSYRRRIRSRSGRGGSVDDTGRVPFPHPVLSSDLWLIKDKGISYQDLEARSSAQLRAHQEPEATPFRPPMLSSVKAICAYRGPNPPSPAQHHEPVKRSATIPSAERTPI